MHDLAPEEQPNVGLNVVWLLLVLFMVPASVQISDEVPSDDTDLDARNERVTRLHERLCQALPETSGYVEFFSDAEDHKPRLTGDRDRDCRWEQDIDDRSRGLNIDVGIGDVDPKSLDADKPYLSLAGIADRAVLAGPRMGEAGGLSLHVRAGETTVTVTAVDQQDITDLPFGAAPGAANYRHLAQTVTDTAIELLKVVDPKVAANVEPLPSVDIKGLPGSLCDAISVPSRGLQFSAQAWPPSDRSVGLCSWVDDPDAEDVRSLRVRVDRVTEVPAAGNTAGDTAEWLWELHAEGVGDPVDEFGEHAVIGVDKEKGLGGLNIRQDDMLIQVMYNAERDSDEDIKSIMTKAASETIAQFE